MDQVELDYISPTTLVPPRKRWHLFCTLTSIFFITLSFCVLAYTVAILRGRLVPGITLFTQLLVNLVILLISMAAGLAILKPGDPQRMRLREATIRPKMSRLAVMAFAAAVVAMITAFFFWQARGWVLRFMFLRDMENITQPVMKVYVTLVVLLSLTAFFLGAVDIGLAFFRITPQRGYRRSVVAVCLSLSWIFFVGAISESTLRATRWKLMERRRDEGIALLLGRECAEYAARYGHYPLNLDIFVSGNNVPTDAKARWDEPPLPLTHEGWVSVVADFDYLADDIRPFATPQDHDLMMFVRRTPFSDVPEWEPDAGTGALKYVHEGYIAVFADHHFEIIFPRDWTARWAAHNAARTALLLPAQSDPLKSN